MGLETATLLAISAGTAVATGAYSVIEGQAQRKDARGKQEQARREGEKIQGETRAQNAAQAAGERRAQIREERVRRGRIMQSAENTGAAASSGEFGAIGTLSTNLATNIGSNLGRIGAAERTSQYAQNAAEFTGQANDALNAAKGADQLFSLSGSIFSAAGGFGAIKGGFSAGGADPIGDFYNKGTRGSGD